MNQRKFISRFSPNRTAPEDLERIHVQRHQLLKEAVDLLRESALTENKHHLLFIGPRGCGKTHLLALIVHRLQAQADLAGRLRIAWLNEDETSTSFLDLLLRIYRALAGRYPDEFPRADLKPLYGRKPEEARLQLEQILVERIQKRTVLVLVENLDALFEQFDNLEQRTWRAFIQNHPVFATAATAQRLFAGVSDREQPFFGFFDTRHLRPLTVDEAAELLQKIAQLNRNNALKDFLATPRGRARVQAIHHLAGGNHRLYIVLSDFVTRETLDELVRPFEEMVDEQLTPYYQERLRWLSPQQRKIVEFLCQRLHPVPVKEISDRLFATHPTIASQLKQLRDMGYVRSHARGRESLYELAEPLMRLSVQIKDTRDRQPLSLLVDFLRVWYERGEIEKRLAGLGATDAGREYFAAALERIKSDEPNLRHQLLRESLKNQDPKDCDESQLETFRVLAEESGECDDWLSYGKACCARAEYLRAVEACTNALQTRSIHADLLAVTFRLRGACLMMLNRNEEAIADFTRVIELPEAQEKSLATMLFARGASLEFAGRSKEAIADYTRSIELPDIPVELLAMMLVNRGDIFRDTGRTEQAITDYTRCVELKEPPVQLLARALINRGNSFDKMNRKEQAIADLKCAIELPTAPPEIIAWGLVCRGTLFLEAGRIDEANSDFTRCIELPGVEDLTIVKALVGRSLTFLLRGRKEQSIADFTRATKQPGIPIEHLLVARGYFIRALFAADLWAEGIVQLKHFLAEHAGCPSDLLPDVSESTIAAIFRPVTSPEIRQARLGEVVKIFAEHKTLSALGDALVRHLAKLEESVLNSEGLDQWLGGWESAASEYPALQLPVRLLRGGIAYLKTSPRDEGVLLQLPAEERQLVRQALALEEEKTE